MRQRCVTLVIVLYAAAAWADCDRTKTDYDVVYCGTKIYLQADQELNDAYKQLVSKLNTEGKQLIKSGQLAWIETRNTQCTTRQTNNILVDLDCATNTTVERTRFLNDRYRECVSAGCLNSKLR